MKHHTSPAFYLSPWGSPDVCQMRLVNGRIIARPRHPNATGFHVDLYKTKGVREENAQDLETKFMSPLDNDAAVAVQMMLAGTEPREPRYRQGWAMFLASLLFRNRETVELLKSHVYEMWAEGTAVLEPVWQAERKDGDAPTFAEATRAAIGDQAGIDASNMLAEIISRSKAIPDIMNMDWTVVDVAGRSRNLLTSDRALVMPLGLANKNAHLAIPISPDKIFAAAYNDRFHRMTASKSHVVRVMNKDVVQQAREFVWGTDDSQVEFVEKNIAKLPDRVIISEDQREEALRAARGETAEPAQA